MKIAVVHSFYTEAQPSGENVVVDAQVEALRRAGHTVDLIARNTDTVSDRVAHSARAALTVASGIGPSPEELLRRINPDVVHVHNTFPNWGTRWLGRWGSKTVVTLHNFRTVCSAGTLFRDGRGCEDCLKSPVVPALRHRCYRGSVVATLPLAWATRPKGAHRRLAKDANRVVVLNQQAKRFLEPVLQRSLDCVPNFVEDAEHIAMEHRSHRWLFVGRLTSEKGILELLEAWPADAELDICGAGPLEQAVRGQVEVVPNMRYLGLVPHTQLLTELSHYRGLVLPSLWAEGLPTVVLEALVRSVPILISSHVAAGRAIAEAGAASIFSEFSEVPGVIEKMTRDLATMGRQARALYEAAYSANIWQERMERIYGSVKAGDRAPG